MGIERTDYAHDNQYHSRKIYDLAERPHLCAPGDADAGWQPAGRAGRVALSIQDPENPYEYIQVRGLVELSTENGARQHIDELSMRYTGHAYQGSPDQVRVIYSIRPMFPIDE